MTAIGPRNVVPANLEKLPSDDSTEGGLAPAALSTRLQLWDRLRRIPGVLAVRAPWRRRTLRMAQL